MECWTVIVISILILMLLNVYFWLYCLFCKRTKRCGDIEYFITVVHKNKNSDNRKQLFPMDVYTSESHSSQGSDNANDENSWEYMCNRPLPTIPEESESLAAAEEEEEPTPEPQQDNNIIEIQADIHHHHPPPQPIPPPPPSSTDDEHFYNVLDPDTYGNDFEMPGVLYE